MEVQNSLRINNILYVPKLSQNMFTVSNASEHGKTTKFSSHGCEVIDADENVIALASKNRNFCYLDYCHKS